VNKPQKATNPQQAMSTTYQNPGHLYLMIMSTPQDDIKSRHHDST
jgi:hypothetical protein